MQAAVQRFQVPPAHAAAFARPRAQPRARLAALILLGYGVWSAPVLAQDRQEPAAHPAHHPAHHAVHEPVHRQPVATHAASRPASHAHPHPAASTHRPPVAATRAPVARPAVVPAPVAPPAAPVAPPAPAKGSSTGLPLPRFASLRADAVNLRGGPGTRYPIQWVYKRRDLPVRIEREFDVWRLVEDSDGVKGWVHQATLVGTRTFVVPGPALSGGAAAASLADPPHATPAATTTATTAAAAPGEPRTPGSSSAPTLVGRMDAATGVLPAGSVALRATPQPDGALVAVLMPGIVGRIRVCSPGSGWCKVSVRDYVGWLPRDAFWGLLPDETILPP